MRILWVKADKLLPVHNGGNIRTYNIVRTLASSHALTFFSYYGGAPDLKYGYELCREVPGAVALNTEKNELNASGRALDYLLQMWRPEPYAVSRFTSSLVINRLKSFLSEGRFDVAVCDFLDAAVNFPRQSRTGCDGMSANPDT